MKYANHKCTCIDWNDTNDWCKYAMLSKHVWSNKLNMIQKLNCEQLN